jgi:membrane-associated progesterone receptor component
MDANSIVLVLAAGMVSYFVLTLIRAIFETFFPSKITAKGYQPQQVGEITLEELSKCTGEDPFRPILVALRGKVYDLTDARNFYGPGGTYHVYAGREAARALAKMSLSAEECTGEISDLDEKEMITLEKWEAKFSAKYKVVGQVRRFNLR